MSVESPRSPPVYRIDPYDRFASRLDEKAQDPDSEIPCCPRCGSEQIDGWMTEGATKVVCRCVLCGRDYDPEHVEQLEEGEA
jgi:hypothetical protein